jgi:hypothetical protein
VTQVLVAPLGELPEEKALSEFGERVLEEDGQYQACTLLPRNSRPRAVRALLQGLLKRVSGVEGVFTAQTSGRVRKHCEQASVLVAAGVHAKRSVYVLHWERVFINWWGKPGDLTPFLRENLHAYPEAKRELKALEGILCRRYPGLESALRNSPEGVGRRPFFAGALERGHVVFLSSFKGRVTHVLVGKALARIRSIWGHYRQKDIWQAPENQLLKVLQETVLGALPSEALLALLRGEASTSVVQEAERVWALARLRGL